MERTDAHCSLLDDNKIGIVVPAEFVRRAQSFTSRFSGFDRTYGDGSLGLLGSVMNSGLIDEVQLMINPLLLDGGKALVRDAKERTALKQIRTKTLRSDKISLTYIVRS
jgi:dihydrofolate reductase